WRGWEGPPQWGFGELDPLQLAEWEHHGRSFVALAGIQWKLLMLAMDKAAMNVPATDLMHVRYEDFIGDPVTTFRNVAEFCELAWSAPFETSIRRKRLKTANEKWRDHLTVEQQALLEDVLAEILQRYGYSPRR
ncbi:MAG: sulfotransferase, partial [Rhodanobacteraceae bacterium]